MLANEGAVVRGLGIVT